MSGSQQGIDLATRLLLDPGECVCIEEPGYPRARAVFAALGSELVPVAVEPDGLDSASLPEGGARMVYVTPSHQYPTGAVLSPERRLSLLDWAERHGAWLLDDDTVRSGAEGAATPEGLPRPSSAGAQTLQWAAPIVLASRSQPVS